MDNATITGLTVTLASPPPTPPPPVIPPVFEDATTSNDNDASIETLKDLIEDVEAVMEETVELSANASVDDTNEPEIIYNIPADMDVILEPQTTVSPYHPVCLTFFVTSTKPVPRI